MDDVDDFDYVDSADNANNRDNADDAIDAVTVVDRRDSPHGEVVLRRRRTADGERFEIIENGCFLMDTSDGRSERLLVRAALEALPGQEAAARGTSTAGGGGRREGAAVLIGGLGVGFSLAEAAGDPRWGSIAVVERESAVIDWHRSGPLARFSGHALDDPRVRVVERDLVSYVREADVTYDALCLDIDNGPDWTVNAANDSLYSPAGLADCRSRLAPGGVLAVWSAQPSQVFEDALRAAGFTQVQTIAVPVARGVPDVVHLGIRPA